MANAVLTIMTFGGAAIILVGVSSSPANMTLVLIGGVMFGLASLVYGATERAAGRPTFRSDGELDQDVAAVVYQRDGGVCAHCGGRDDVRYAHPIAPEYGGRSEDNTMLLCGRCLAQGVGCPARYRPG